MASLETATIPSVVTGRRVLLIDDERRILNFLSRALRREGLFVETASDGEEGLKKALGSSYDLVVLDLLMPGLDGTAVLGRLMQRKPHQAVLVLSALSEPSSKVICLELGAEDYLAKPFSLDELVARVHVRLRDAARLSPTRLRVGTIGLDVIRREADAGTGPVPLSEREFLLLLELMQHGGQVVSKERLLSAVWGYHFDPESNVVDVYVGRLRSKLGTGAIITVRGEGYRVDGA